MSSPAYACYGPGCAASGDSRILSAPLAIVSRGSRKRSGAGRRERGAARLGFALLLKFYARAGRFPRGRAELDDDAMAFVAHQVGVPASDPGSTSGPG